MCQAQVKLRLRFGLRLGLRLKVGLRLGLGLGGQGWGWAYFFGQVGEVGGWLEIWRVKLISTQVAVEVEVGVELGKIQSQL